MTSRPSILFIGHSHIVCIAAAAERMGITQQVGVIDLRDIKATKVIKRTRGMKAGQAVASEVDRPALSKREREVLAVREDVRRIVRASPITHPDAVCLCIKGNHHNIIGLVENPQPISVGDRYVGAVPPTEGERYFIPYRVLWDTYDDRYVRRLVPRLFAAFPNAKRFYLDAPPPIVDWERIQAEPWFHVLQGSRPAPNELKKKLHQVQQEVFKDMAAKAGAMFIEADDSLLEGGFLSVNYCFDATHGNVAYGEVMLETVMRNVGTL